MNLDARIEFRDQVVYSIQDTELLLFTAETKEELRTQLSQLLEFSFKLSSSEIVDLAVKFNKNINFNLPIRAAIIASKPDELTSRLHELILLIDGELENNKNSDYVFFGVTHCQPKIGVNSCRALTHMMP